jgi:hypothetical protein
MPSHFLPVSKGHATNMIVALVIRTQDMQHYNHGYPKQIVQYVCNPVQLKLDLPLTNGCHIWHLNYVFWGCQKYCKAVMLNKQCIEKAHVVSYKNSPKWGDRIDYRTKMCNNLDPHLLYLEPPHY